MPAPPSREFSCHLFMFCMASGGWRTIVDLSTLTSQWWQLVFSDGICSSDSPLGAVVRMCGFYNLKDYPSGWGFLRVASSSGSLLGKAWCFQALCFVLFSASAVFARVFAPVSSCQACGYCALWTPG